MKAPKIVVEEMFNGILVVTKIINSSELRVDSLITKEQVSKLIMGGWNTQRIASSNASKKRRAQSGVRRPLSDAEIAAAISKRTMETVMG